MGQLHAQRNVGQADYDEPQKAQPGNMRAAFGLAALVTKLRLHSGGSLLLGNSFRDDVIWLSATVTRGS